MQRQDDNRPAAWRQFFGVASSAAANATIEAEGGTVTLNPMEVPGGEWILVASDPQGAEFGLVGGQ